MSDQANFYEDKSIGCLIGGAIGDALGYAIEFRSEEQIKSKYGYVKTFVDTPLISDDTQMTMYTAVSMCFAVTRGIVRGVGGDPREMSYLRSSYRRWYEGQSGLKNGVYPSFLRLVPHFNDRRAPGVTCCSALSTGELYSIDKPYSKSKGCGGVMRVAPIGLFFGVQHSAYRHNLTVLDAIKTGADAAALTHGHFLGYVPAAYLSGLIYQIVHPHLLGGLEGLAEEVLRLTKDQFGSHYHWQEFESIVRKAFALAKDPSISDLDAIHELGEGWVGEEALAISLFSALRHQDSFGDAIACAVNHKGDSDSTGAITGNILGAYLGLEEIKKSFPDYWKVEFYDLITEVGKDLCDTFENAEIDKWWATKYECDDPRESIINHWVRFRSEPPK